MSNELTTMANRLAALRQQASQTHEVWQPMPGETLAGEYTGHIQVNHPKYGDQWQLLLKDEQGDTYAVWLNPWLKNSLKAQSLAIGDLVAITFIGKKQTATGATYNAYGLIVDKH